FALVHFAPDRTGVVDILSGADGARIATLRAPGIGPGRTQAVVWGKGGTRLAIGGSRTLPTTTVREAIDAVRGFVVEFDMPGGSARAPKDVASDATTDLQRLSNGRIAYASFDSSWGVIDPVSQQSLKVGGADFVRRSDRLWLLPSAAGVQWQTS